MSSEGRPANNTGKDTDSAIGTGRGVLRPGALCDVIMKPKKQRERSGLYQQKKLQADR